MAKVPKHIDISGIPELLSLALDVRRSNEPRVLKYDSKNVAILMPINKTTHKRDRTMVKIKADHEAFLSAAGSWADVDTDKLIKNIYESRRTSSRPLVKL